MVQLVRGFGIVGRELRAGRLIENRRSRLGPAFNFALAFSCHKQCGKGRAFGFATDRHRIARRSAVGPTRGCRSSDDPAPRSYRTNRSHRVPAAPDFRSVSKRRGRNGHSPSSNAVLNENAPGGVRKLASIAMGAAIKIMCEQFELSGCRRAMQRIANRARVSSAQSSAEPFSPFQPARSSARKSAIQRSRSIAAIAAFKAQHAFFGQAFMLAAQFFAFFAADIRFQ